MFINATGFYVPEERVDNQHFLELNGLTSEWIEQRTGIRSRSKAKAEENINTMSMEAVRNALPKLPYDITDVDLIVSASYSPYDTVATAAHLAQHEFHIENAKALYLSFFRLLLITECVGSCGRVFCYGKSNKSVDPFRRQEFGLL
jgi:3-oxoacyl-[acyl-carrier-protein] synthase 3 protein 2